MMDSWTSETKVSEYLGRVGRIEARLAGERELVELIPPSPSRVLDLGCGDGRLLALVLDSRPALSEAIGLDYSAPMLEAARQQFASQPRVQILEHDLREPLAVEGPFDLIVSGFAIHHLSHDRKQSLLTESAARLRPGGVFANLEVVQCATPELHEEFNRRIERPGGDPEDQLAPVEPQLAWMRSAGMEQVDCFWRWRGFALLAGQKPH